MLLSGGTTHGALCLRSRTSRLLACSSEHAVSRLHAQAPSKANRGKVSEEVGTKSIGAAIGWVLQFENEDEYCYAPPTRPVG